MTIKTTKNQVATSRIFLRRLGLYGEVQDLRRLYFKCTLVIPAYTFVCDRTLLQAIAPTFPRLIFCITLSSEEILGAIAVQRVRCLQRTARALTSLRGRC